MGGYSDLLFCAFSAFLLFPLFLFISFSHFSLTFFAGLLCRAGVQKQSGAIGGGGGRRGLLVEGPSEGMEYMGMVRGGGISWRRPQ